LTQVLLSATLALAGLVAALIAAIFLRRTLEERRQRREDELRPQVETSLADYLAFTELESPGLPDSPLTARLLREAGLEAIIQLRGQDRERLTHLLEEGGIVAEAVKELRSRRHRRRRHAAEYLAEIRSRQAAEGLRHGLGDRDLGVRQACGRALAELGELELLDGVVDAAEEGAQELPGEAAAVLLAIADREPDGLADALTEQRSDALRRLAFAVVAERRLAQFAPELRDGLASPDQELASRAARGLGAIGDSDAVDSLLLMLSDRDRPLFCRVSVANALGKIGETRAVPPLQVELESGGWLMQTRAATALSALGEPGRTALRQVSSSSNPQARDNARVALEG
jgi:HEAT repeat protein